MLVPSIITQEREGKDKDASFKTLKVQRSTYFFDSLSCKEYEPVYTGRVIQVEVIKMSVETTLQSSGKAFSEENAK